MSGSTTFKPNIKWYQNKDTVSFEIDHRDIQNENIKIEPNQVSINFKLDNKDYEDVLELFSEIDEVKSSIAKFGYSITVHLKKKENGFWKHLTKNDKLKRNIKVDWNNFNDSEEEEEKKEEGLPAGMDF